MLEVGGFLALSVGKIFKNCDDDTFGDTCKNLFEDILY